MLKFIFKTIDVQSQKLGKLLAVLAGVAVFLMMLVVVADFTLVGLKFGSLSISVGLVEMLMIVAIFGAIAYADVLDRHVICLCCRHDLFKKDLFKFGSALLSFYMVCGSRIFSSRCPLLD